MRRQHQGHQRKPWSKKKEQKNLIKEKKSKNVDFSVFLYWDNDDDIDDDDVGDDTCTGCILRIFPVLQFHRFDFDHCPSFQDFLPKNCLTLFLFVLPTFLVLFFSWNRRVFMIFFSVFSREPLWFHDFFQCFESS